MYICSSVQSDDHDIPQRNEEPLQMSEIHKELMHRIVQLEEIIENMKKDNVSNGRKVASDVLSTIFTPGQVKRLLDPNRKRSR